MGYVDEVVRFSTKNFHAEGNKFVYEVEVLGVKLQLHTNEILHKELQEVLTELPKSVIIRRSGDRILVNDAK